VAEPPQGCREIDVVEEQLALSEHVDDETRRNAIEHAQGIEESARQRAWRRPAEMSDPALGLLMLGLIVVVIIMASPRVHADGTRHVLRLLRLLPRRRSLADNHIFDLMVQRTYGAMTNDVLISIPLFVLMGYVMERGRWWTRCSTRSSSRSAGCRRRSRSPP